MSFNLANIETARGPSAAIIVGDRVVDIAAATGREDDRSMLAIMADFVPHGLANALGQIRGGTSLDNTIRFRRVVPTDWVLCEVQADGVHDGIGYGAMRLFSQDGELMATASQSVVMWTPRE